MTPILLLIAPILAHGPLRVSPARLTAEPLATAAVSAGALGMGGDCQVSWQPTFGPALELDGSIQAFSVFDDGSGSALYAGGDFTRAGGLMANGIARWDGTSWSSLGSGMMGPPFDIARVAALAVFDDGGGAGPALFAGGDFVGADGVETLNIARWDGVSWSPVGSGMNAQISALAVFDDGSGGGPALYAGGYFSSAGGVAARRIAKWNGTSWSALGLGMQGGAQGVFALQVFDDGGPALYAGGYFSSAGGVAVNSIAKWDGVTWSPLGSGMDSSVQALTAFDDGSGGGPALYAGGFFTSAGGVAASRIARWDGAMWSPLGRGMSGGAPRVHALTVFDDGGGAALYAGGSFTSAGGVAANSIAQWNGTTWSPLGSGMNSNAIALAVFDDGSGAGQALYAGGSFTNAGGVTLSSIAHWDGAAWSRLGKGLNSTVLAVTVFDDGGGPALYAGGNFTSADDVAVNGIARWNGTSWSPLGSGMVDGLVQALAVFDDGSGGGPELYAGGFFTTAGGVAAKHIAKWNGTSWSPLGNGMNSQVFALAVFDDGSGPELYAGGTFTLAGSHLAFRIAKWNGASWSPLGSGMDAYVAALTVFDDGGGSGPALYAGGRFVTAGGVQANNIAKWDGANWSSLESGMSGGVFPNGVFALTVFDDGVGPALYVGGSFTTVAGGLGVNNIAKWDGANWSSLGSGMNDRVQALTVFDDGSGAGPALLAGGGFLTADGVAANHSARWNGTNWSPLGSGMNGSVQALTMFNDQSGTGPALIVGGDFTSAIDSGDGFLARWQGCDAFPPTLSCPTSIVAIDAFSGPSGEVVTFTVQASDDSDPAPSVVCVPASGSFFPRGTTLVTCTATDAAGNQSTCEFPVVVQLKVRRR